MCYGMAGERHGMRELAFKFTTCYHCGILVPHYATFQTTLWTYGKKSRIWEEIVISMLEGSNAH
jgi:hypothetical protein